MTTAALYSHRALALVGRLQQLLVERQQLLRQEHEDGDLSVSHRSRRKARLHELRAEITEALEALAVLIPPECPGRFSRSDSVA